MKSGADEVRDARDFLLRHRTDYKTTYAGFRWPRPQHFNFALDWMDEIARTHDKEALRIVSDSGPVVSRTFSDLSHASNRIANFLRAAGAKRGDAVLIMLGNVAPLWESMLAAMKLGVAIIPATPLLSRDDVLDRIARGGVRYVIAASEFHDRFQGSPDWRGISVGAAVPGWLALEDAALCSAQFEPDGETNANDPLLLYFTSGTTSRPKLVQQSHQSYPVGLLSTLYWLGLRRDDIHLNISSPGWAKHAWSCVFAPWLAEATVLALNHTRFNARATLDVIAREQVTSFCAPPTVWRMIVQEDLPQWQTMLRELAGAGEPLNPEIIARVEQAWGLTIRDGYGQTETSALIANTPGQKIVPGAMGRPLPGFEIELRDENGNIATEGQVSVKLRPLRPVGIMDGYRVDGTLQPLDRDVYQTGDIATVDGDGTLTYVGRADDVFKASDYRISPFELESVLIEHPAVVEAAVVPSPDPMKLAVPKAFVTLSPKYAPNAETAASILAHARKILGPFRRVRRIEFAELPKTVSGKIRRADLRKQEAEQCAKGLKSDAEWCEDDFTHSD